MLENSTQSHNLLIFLCVITHPIYESMSFSISPRKWVLQVLKSLNTQEKDNIETLTQFPNQYMKGFSFANCETHRL